jgi:hypothetical protein
MAVVFLVWALLTWTPAGGVNAADGDNMMCNGANGSSSSSSASWSPAEVRVALFTHGVTLPCRRRRDDEAGGAPGAGGLDPIHHHRHHSPAAKANP